MEHLLAGIGLLLALRGALAGAAWSPIALCLPAALLAHLADPRRRRRGRPTAVPPPLRR